MSIAGASRLRDAMVATAEADARTHGATLNDLLSGLVGALAFYTAAIPSPHREAMQRDLVIMFESEVARCIKAGVGPNVEAMVMTGGVN